MADFGGIDILQVEGLTALLDDQAAALTAHAGDTDNPHEVTAEQTGAVALTQRGAANGVATLDANSKIPASQLPSIAIGTKVTVADQAARFALTTAQVQNGDIVVQTDNGTTYFVSDDTNLGNSNGYTAFGVATNAPVTSVFGREGDVVLTLADVQPFLIGTNILPGGHYDGQDLDDSLDDLNDRLTDVENGITNAVWADPIPLGASNGMNKDYVPRVGGATPFEPESEAGFIVLLKRLPQILGIDYNWVNNPGTGGKMAQFVNAPAAGWPVRFVGKVVPAT